MVNDNGKVILTATAPTATLDIPWLLSSGCNARTRSWTVLLGYRKVIAWKELRSDEEPSKDAITLLRSKFGDIAVQPGKTLGFVGGNVSLDGWLC